MRTKERPVIFDDVGSDSDAAVLNQNSSNDDINKKSSYGPRETISYQDDTSLDQWCAIRVIEYRYRPEQIKNNERVVCDIMLPMPLQLQTGYNQQWTELDDLSALISQMANETGKGVQDILNDPKGFLKEFGETASSAFARNTSDLLKNIALNPTAAAAIGGIVGGGFAGAVTGTEGGVAAGAAAGATIAQATSRAVGTIGGLAANKYQTVTFEKPQLRQHQFSWNLIARSQEQAKRIQRIIHKLKYHSSPDQRGGRAFGFFKYPELFALHFDGGEGSPNAKGNKNLFSISPSAMSSFNVDYHGAGRPLYSYTDKQPLSVTISMTLQEVVVVTKKTIEDFNR